MKTRTSYRHHAIFSFLLNLSLALSACAPMSSPFVEPAQSQVSQIEELKEDLKEELALVLVEASRPIEVSSALSKRERVVAIDRLSLAKIVSRAESSSDRTLRVQLKFFADQTTTLLIDSVEAGSNGSLIIGGSIENDPDSAATLVLNEGTVVGHVNRGQSSERFEILPSRDGHHVVREFDSLALSSEQECQVIAAGPETETIPSSESVDEYAPLAMAMPSMDILVAYTVSARINSGGLNGINALIQMGVADANRAYADSGIALRIRLVGTMEVRANESVADMTKDLYSLQGLRDGKWDEVHAERERLGADQVTLVGAYTGNRTSAGVGFTPARRASSAFAVVTTSAFSQYTFAHELGHNLGLDHGDGYVSGAGRFRTIIAYGSYPRIRRFSNPALRYNGFLTGDSRHNEAAIINSNAARVAGFRASRN